MRHGFSPTQRSREGAGSCGYLRFFGKRFRWPEIGAKLGSGDVEFGFVTNSHFCGYFAHPLAMFPDRVVSDAGNFGGFVYGDAPRL